MNHEFRSSLIGVILSLASFIAFATDGTQLLRDCRAAEQFDESKSDRNSFGIGRCLGIVEGVTGMLESVSHLLPADLRVCFPEKLLALQSVRIVLKYLRENPVQHHEAASYLMALAFHRAFPCKP